MSSTRGIELSEKRCHHITVFEPDIRKRKPTSAYHASFANVEHLHLHLATFTRQRKDITINIRLRHDLLRLNRPLHGVDSVAQTGGILEPFVRGRLMHFSLDIINELPRLAAQKENRPTSLFGIRGFVRQPNARPQTSLHLEFDTRSPTPRIVIERTLRAGSKRKETAELGKR